MVTSRLIPALGLVGGLAVALLGAGSAQALNLRVEGGVGYTIGQNTLDTSTPLGGSTLATHSDAFGGGGLAANAGVWLDSPLAGWMGGSPAWDNFSVGLQYLHFDNPTQSTVGASGAFASLNTELNVNAAMVNIAWRLNHGNIHPFVGAGGGAAFSSLNGSVSAGTLGGTANFDSKQSKTSPAGQFFAGLDYDLSPNLYVGATGRFFFTDASYNNLVPGTAIDVSSHQLSLMAHVGWRF